MSTSCRHAKVKSVLTGYTVVIVTCYVKAWAQMSARMIAQLYDVIIVAY